MAAAAVAMVAVYVTNMDSSAPMEQTRVKGKTAPMEVWIKTTKGSREVRVGEALTQGDEVQVKFRPDGAKWVTVAGREFDGCRLSLYRGAHKGRPPAHRAPGWRVG